MNLYNTFEQRVNNSNLELINFEAIITQPMAKYEVWNRYKLDIYFRRNVDEMRKMNSSFNYRWNKYFSSFYERDNSFNQENAEKPKIKANTRRFN